MSPRRRSWPAIVGTVATCALLSGCFGSGGSDSSADHPGKHHSGSTPPSTPTGPSTSAGTSKTPSTGNAAVLRFSPESDGKHSHDCLKLHPGDDPAEFLYYPVVVTTSTPIHLGSITTQHSAGVVVAGAWVAPAPVAPSTGTLPGWPPPKILTSSSSVQWSKRVVAAGATLDPSAGWYNIFLRIQVDPTPGDSKMSGVQIAYHDAAGDHTVTWVDHVKFSMSC
jgi:hypothetical protein